MRPHPFERIFSPRAAAVVSAGPASDVAARLLANLAGGGLRGALHAVGGARDLAPPGVRVAASLAEVEGELDLALLSAPAGELPALVADCAARGVAGAVLLAGPGGAAGLEPAARQALLAAAAGRVRLIGPDSLGLARPVAGLQAVLTGGVARPGSLGLVSQSGAICATLIDWAEAHRVGFSAVASLGGALDVDFGDLLEYLAFDPETRSILLYVERVAPARAFLSGLRLAARVKPVVVVKAGRHPAGAAGTDEAFDAALARTGAVRVRTVEQLFAAAQLLATRRAVAGSRLAIVSNARGPALLAADRAGDLGLQLPPLDAATQAGLARLLPPGAPAENPVDLQGDAGPERYGAAVGLALADPGVDAVLALLAPQLEARPQESAEAVVAALRGRSKPLLACWMGEGLVRGALGRFVEAGVPEFSTPESAVDGFGLLAAYAHSQRLLRQVPEPVSPEARPHLDRARDAAQAALARGRSLLTTGELQRVLAAVGVRDRGAAGQRVSGTGLHVAVRRDPVFGPVLRFGRHGPAGLMGDPVVALPPLDTAIIRTLVGGSRLAPLFSPEGGMTAAGAEASERFLWALSELVSEVSEVVALELSPLVVAGGELYAASARVEVARPPPGAGRYDHMAIHPVPTDLRTSWTLPDGVRIEVRPIRAEDAEMEASFVRHLSAATRHNRFLTAVKELSRDVLIRFTQLDYARDLALVAVVLREGREEQIAVARYSRTAPETVHLALVVADAWQGRGIGERLLVTLIEAAQRRGVRHLEGEVLAGNRPIQSLLSRIGFTFRRDPDGGDVLLIERHLDPPEAPFASPPAPK